MEMLGKGWIANVFRKPLMVTGGPIAPVHQTLRVTPAMEAGVADHVWTMNEIVGLLG